jgi:flagellar protein FlbD
MEHESDNAQMIKLTRLDGDPFILNADLIQYVEALPDTFVTLIGGERIVVREPPDSVMDLAVRYQQSKYLIPPPEDRREQAMSTAQQ